MINEIVNNICTCYRLQLSPGFHGDAVFMELWLQSRFPPGCESVRPQRLWLCVLSAMLHV